MKYRFLLVTVLAIASCFGQAADGFLPAAKSTELLERSLQLIEATTAASPDSGRAVSPVLEDARQALMVLRNSPRVMPSQLLAYLGHARTYLAISGALPKPTPVSEETRKQFAELRTDLDLLDSHFRALLLRTEAQLRPPDRDNLRRYADTNTKLGPPDAAKPRVVFMGDSITDGWRLAEYFPEKDYVNRGISGQITGEMLGRMMADVLVHKPAAMILLAGTNDLARNVAINAIESNIAMIGELAEAYKIKVILSSILPVSDYHKGENPRNEMTLLRPPAKIIEVNTWMEAYAKQRGWTYCNYFNVLVDGAGQLQADLAPDGLHPNAEGYRVMAPVAQTCVDQALTPKPVTPVQQNTKKRRLSF